MSPLLVMIFQLVEFLVTQIWVPNGSYEVAVFSQHQMLHISSPDTCYKTSGTLIEHFRLEPYCKHGGDFEKGEVRRTHEDL